MIVIYIRMNMLAITISLASILTVALAGGGVDDSLIQPYSVNNARGNLTCHRCVRSVHGYNCVVLRDTYRIEREHCKVNHNFCMVEKYVTNGEIQTFTRGCAEQCTPGCESAGVNYVVNKCYSCCNTDFCNVGNKAIGLHPSNMLFVVLSASFHIGILAV